MSKETLVSIRCITYNHESYIRDCLEGFVIQNTSFPFEAIVHDDASTDGTAAIIREYAEKYPDIIKPIYETENQYSKHDGSLRRIMDEAISPSAKYIAICEGDDYWIDPLKLQKQADFLETHPDYGLVSSDFFAFRQKDGQCVNFSQSPIMDGNCFLDIVTEKKRVQTLTVCIRKNIFFSREKLDPAKYFLGDQNFILTAALKSKIYCFPQKMGVYRILEESAVHSKKKNNYKMLDFSFKYYNTKIFYLNKLPHENYLRRKWIAKSNFVIFRYYLVNNLYSEYINSENTYFFSFSDFSISLKNLFANICKNRLMFKITRLCYLKLCRISNK